MNTSRPFEIGLFTFGEITADPLTGRAIDPAVRLREFIDLARLGEVRGDVPGRCSRRDASNLLTNLYSRGIRFDERNSQDPAVPGPLVDITVYRSKYNSKQLATTRQFNLIAAGLANIQGLNRPDKKYFAWLDAGSQYCGQANLSQDTKRTADNQNEGKTLALVYRPYATTDGSGGFCRGRTLRHELGHNMGALQSGAPHAFDGAHCNDSAEDTMCYTSATTPDTGQPDFDYNNDDYWDPIANPPCPTPAPSSSTGRST